MSWGEPRHQCFPKSFWAILLCSQVGNQAVRITGRAESSAACLVSARGWLWLLGDGLLMFTRVAVIGLTGSRAGSNQAVMDATHFEDNLWPRWILGFEEKSCRCCQEGAKGGGEAGGARQGRPRGHLPSCLQFRAHLESAPWCLAELNCLAYRMRVMVPPSRDCPEARRSWRAVRGCLQGHDGKWGSGGC